VIFVIMSAMSFSCHSAWFGGVAVYLYWQAAIGASSVTSSNNSSVQYYW
jgi:hypothetical protein